MKPVFAISFLIILIFSCKNDNKESKETPLSPQQKFIDSFQSIIKDQKENDSVRLKFVNSLDSMKLYDLAILHLDTLINKDSINNELWITKAQLQEVNKDTAGAIISYEKAIAIYPSEASQLYLANLYAESRNKKALAVCNNIANLGMGRETDAYCNFIAGVYFARTGNTKKALQLFDLAILNNYTLMEAYMEKGFIFYENKNYHEALKVFETAITVNNQYADAYYWKAKTLEASGNKNEAIENYKRSFALDKQLIEAANAIKRLEIQE